MNRIVIGADHGGFEYKKAIIEHLEKKDYEVIDVGTFSSESVDYPDIAQELAKIVINDNIPGILICGTGIGISIAANKCKGIRAALCHDEFSARMTKKHNDSNVLAMGQRVIGIGLALSIVDTWLDSEFEGGRHGKRIEKMMNLEEL
ncbi:MAG: ribose 5-phosphate isomerase B [Erysipelotrichales bacterium]